MMGLFFIASTAKIVYTLLLYKGKHKKAKKILDKSQEESNEEKDSGYHSGKI